MKILDIFFPKATCIICGQELKEDGGQLLCCECLATIETMRGGKCLLCGRHVLQGSLCGLCRKQTPLFVHAYSPFSYEGTIRKLIALYKYENMTVLADFFADYLVDEIQAQKVKADIVAYVPMTPLRCFKRGYNQGYLLAQAVAKRLKIDSARRGIKKTRSTKSQAVLTAAKRQQNLMGAFVANEVYRDKIVLLVDDVLTTASTANAVSSALLNAGANQVYVVTIASTDEVKNE